jgi:hypothetical protein
MGNVDTAGADCRRLAEEFKEFRVERLCSASAADFLLQRR